MEKSALDGIEDINSSYSNYKYIEDEEKVKAGIIYVEGDTDETFYSRFTKRYHIFRGSDSEREKNYNVERKVLEKCSQGKNVYGIIDPDYSNANNIPKKIRDKIHVIDANSLETLIVKYSDETHEPKKAIYNFNIFFRKGKYIENGKKETININAHKYDEITEDVLKWSYYIGNIRKINDRRKYHLNFKLIKEQSNYYRDYIKKDNENPKQKIFCQEEYLRNLCEQSEDPDSFLKKIEESIEEYNDEKVWEICQGHDIFDFIECLGPNSSNSDTVKGKMHKRETVRPWEYNLLKAFDITAFQNSPLQDWFDKINSKLTEKHRTVVKVTK